MFLSLILIDIGTDPDRPRPGRTWLRNLYHVHQRLCMAFPSKQQKDNDDLFLQPFAPEQFAQDHVHVPRSSNAGFLFGIDPQSNGRCAILVLSALKPEWDYAFQNARHLLAVPPQTKPFALTVAAGQRLRFRLLANAVFRARQESKHRNGQPVQERWVNKRIGVGSDEKALRNWIERRAATAGFSVAELTLMQASYTSARKPTGEAMSLRSVRYEGVLSVTDPAKFLPAVESGIGPAKAFGFGLLSLAPA